MQYSIEINSPIEKVYQLFTDRNNILKWQKSVQEQNFALATNLLTRLKGLQLSPTQTAEMQLNHAKMLKSQNKFDEALQVLNFEAWWKIEDSQWVEYYQLRYELHLFNGDNLNAARELISLNAYTPEDQKQQLWSQVWTSISSFNSTNLQDIKLDESETTLHGWVQLATYLDTLKHSPTRLQEALNEWLEANPTHPAATYTPQDSIGAKYNAYAISAFNTLISLFISIKYNVSSSIFSINIFFISFGVNTGLPRFSFT